MIGPSSVLPHASGLIEQGIHEGLHFGAQWYVSMDGQTLVDEAQGEERPGHPLNPETVLCWMSSVKPITAVAILQLMQQGALDLDCPIMTWIPEFARGGKEAITLRHVLTHTGGFRTADAEWRDETWEEALQRVCASELEADWIPGEKAGYHIDGGWYVLGEVIRRVTDGAYRDYIRTHIFDPIQLDHAWIGLPDDRANHAEQKIGRLYVVKQGALVPHPFANTPEGRRQVRPGGNGRGPMKSLGRFYEDLLAGWLRDESALCSQEHIRLMTARVREGLFDETFRHTMDWGLGVMPNNNRHGAQTVPYGFGLHASDATFGHGGSQSSVGFVDPEHALVVALAFNGMPGEPRHQKRIRHVLTALYEDLDLVP